jgi:hypothetical protein
LDKEAGAEEELPIAARVAAAILGFAALNAISKGVHKDREEQDLVAEAERELEADRMSAVINSLKKQSSVHIAIDAGRYMASLEKNAFGAPLLAMASKAKGAIGSALKGLKPGWKAKAAIGAGTLGAGVLAYKGLKATAGHITSPSQGYGQWGTTGPAYQNVSEYGYPTA